MLPITIYFVYISPPHPTHSSFRAYLVPNQTSNPHASTPQSLINIMALTRKRKGSAQKGTRRTKATDAARKREKEAKAAEDAERKEREAKAAEDAEEGKREAKAAEDEQNEAEGTRIAAEELREKENAERTRRSEEEAEAKREEKEKAQAIIAAENVAELDRLKALLAEKDAAINALKLRPSPTSNKPLGPLGVTPIDLSKADDQAKDYVSALTPECRKSLLKQLINSGDSPNKVGHLPKASRGRKGVMDIHGNIVDPLNAHSTGQSPDPYSCPNPAQQNLLVALAQNVAKANSSSGASRQLISTIAGIKPLEEFHADIVTMLAFFLACANLAEGDDYRPAFTTMTIKSTAIVVKKGVRESLAKAGPHVTIDTFKDCVTRLLTEAHGLSYAVLSEGTWPSLKQMENETAARYASRGFEQLEAHTFCIEDSDRVQKSFARYWINGLDASLRTATINKTGDVPTMKEARSAAITAERARGSIHSHRSPATEINHYNVAQPVPNQDMVKELRASLKEDIKEMLRTIRPSTPPPNPSGAVRTRRECEYHKGPRGCTKGERCSFAHIGPGGSRGAPARTPFSPTCFICQGKHYQWACPKGNGCPNCGSKTHGSSRCPTASPSRSGDKDRSGHRDRDRNQDRRH